MLDIQEKIHVQDILELTCILLLKKFERRINKYVYINLIKMILLLYREEIRSSKNIKSLTLNMSDRIVYIL